MPCVTLDLTEDRILLEESHETAHGLGGAIGSAAEVVMAGSAGAWGQDEA